MIEHEIEALGRMNDRQVCRMRGGAGLRTLFILFAEVMPLCC